MSLDNYGGAVASIALDTTLTGGALTVFPCDLFSGSATSAPATHHLPS